MSECQVVVCASVLSVKTCVLLPFSPTHATVSGRICEYLATFLLMLCIVHVSRFFFHSYSFSYLHFLVDLNPGDWNWLWIGCKFNVAMLLCFFSLTFTPFFLSQDSSESSHWQYKQACGCLSNKRHISGVSFSMKRLETTRLSRAKWCNYWSAVECFSLPFLFRLFFIPVY